MVVRTMNETMKKQVKSEKCMTQVEPLSRVIAGRICFVPLTVGLRASASAKNSCVKDVMLVRLRKLSTVVRRVRNVNTFQHFKILGRSPFVLKGPGTVWCGQKVYSVVGYG